MVEGPGFGEGETGIYVKDITEGGPAQKVHKFYKLAGEQINLFQKLLNQIAVLAGTLHVQRHIA